MLKSYRRVETITAIVIEDHVLVTDDKVTRTGLPDQQAKSYKVQWFNEDGMELPESSAIYTFLEAEFHKLPED